ncbi:MAG: AI-2E family transporter [Anaerolineae bacterium]|nr:AI-2E family transporter [Anaerolineae bacterium]MDW8172176.1 AI-2E family transporter [Anaerolineae bacterium]
MAQDTLHSTHPSAPASEDTPHLVDLQEDYSPQWGRTTRTIALIGLIVGGVYALTLLAPVFQMLSISLMVAFLLYSPSKALSRRFHLSWPASVAIVYLTTLVTLFIIILTLVPSIIRGVNTLSLSAQLGYESFIQRMSEYQEEQGFVEVVGVTIDLNPILIPLRNFVVGTGTTPDELLSEIPVVSDVAKDETQEASEDDQPAAPAPEATPVPTEADTSIAESVSRPTVGNPALLIEGVNLQQLISSLSSVVGGVTGTVTSAIGTLTGFLATLLLSLFVSLLILLDMPKTRQAFEDWASPLYKREIRELIRRIVVVWNSFFRGQVAIGVIIGAATYIQLVLMGIANAEILAIVTGFISLIPTVGGFIALAPLSLVPLLQGSSVFTELSNVSVALLVVGINIFISQIIWNVLAPKILGDALDLSLSVVVVGIFIGAAVGGVLGAFLVAPVMATIRVIVEYTLHKLNGRDPFPQMADRPTIGKAATAPPPPAPQAATSPQATAPSQPASSPTPAEA